MVSSWNSKRRMRFNRFIHLFLLLLLWLLATKSTKYIGKKKPGNFNRGECLGSPHTGYGTCILRVLLTASRGMNNVEFIF